MRRIFILGAAALALTASVPVFANVLPVIDWAAIGHQATQIEHEVTMIENQATQIRGQITWLGDSARNLARLPNTFQDAVSKIDNVTMIGKVADSVDAEVRGTVAAQKVLQDSSSDAAETNRLNGMASRANGAQQQAQVTNGYLSQQNLLLEKQNALTATGQYQHAAEERAQAQSLVNLGKTVQNAMTMDVPNGP